MPPVSENSTEPLMSAQQLQWFMSEYKTPLSSSKQILKLSVQFS